MSKAEHRRTRLRKTLVRGKYRAAEICHEHHGKVKMSEKEARRAAANLGAQQKAVLDAYACQFGAHWHIGHRRSENRDSKVLPGLGRVTIKRFDR